MPRVAALEFQSLAHALRQATPDEVWRRRLYRLERARQRRLHVAIMHEPFLSLLMDRGKTIESRFTVNRIAPYQRAAAGDVLALKKPAGAVVGLALVADVRFYELDPREPTMLSELRRSFAVQIAATDDEFWEARAHKRYVTLLDVAHPIAISAVEVRKRDRRSWAALEATTLGQRDRAA